jgi:Holliday junction resolvasome RuvABC endonuclease subunit
MPMRATRFAITEPNPQKSRNPEVQMSENQRILALDPGTLQTGWAVYDPQANRVESSGVSPNELILERLRNMQTGKYRFAMERIVAMGMPMGESTIATVYFSGRCIEALHGRGEEVTLLSRPEIKLTLCGQSRAKDPNVRQALIDRVGEPGTKKAPGPTYGVKSHAWAALAVAVCVAEFTRRTLEK